MSSFELFSPTNAIFCLLLLLSGHLFVNIAVIVSLYLYYRKDIVNKTPIIREIADFKTLLAETGWTISFHKPYIIKVLLDESMSKEKDGNISNATDY